MNYMMDFNMSETHCSQIKFKLLYHSIFDTAFLSGESKLVTVPGQFSYIWCASTPLLFKDAKIVDGLLFALSEEPFGLLGLYEKF